MDLMIDLETFGLGSSPAIVQIGACLFSIETDDQPLFNPEASYPAWKQWAFNNVINLQSSLLFGASIDMATLDWWRSQSAEAKAAIATNGALNLEEALSNFTAFYENHDIKHIWSHGAASDIPWLEASYRLLGYKIPWRHTQVRDTRTLFWLADMSGWERGDMEGVQHDALDDAKAQARDVRNAFAWIGRNGIRDQFQPPSD